MCFAPKKTGSVVVVLHGWSVWLVCWECERGIERRLCFPRSLIVKFVFSVLILCVCVCVLTITGQNPYLQSISPPPPPLQGFFSCLVFLFLFLAIGHFFSCQDNHFSFIRGQSPNGCTFDFQTIQSFGKFLSC